MVKTTLRITPVDALIDVERTICVQHLLPGQQVEISATTRRGDGVLWRSTAWFEANDQGIVDLSQQAPIRGDYKGISAMGLIWSQQPVDVADREVFLPNVMEPLETTVQLHLANQTLESRFIQRLAGQGVQRIEVRENGLVGTVFVPATPGPHPAVMILNGSGGGVNEPRGALYASHGYLAFSLAYFKAPGLSDYISNTPLEYFKKGLDWLRATYKPAHDFVALNGQSRGGELVLLLASLFPEDVSAVVAYVPGAVVHSGQNAADPQVGREGPAWLLNGKALTHVWENNKTATWAPFDEGPAPHRHEKAILTALQDPDAVARARIQVEKIQAPIILLSGTDDGSWPSSLYSKMVSDKLKEVGYPYEVCWVDTPEAGHSIVFPYIPTTQLIYQHPVSKRLSTSGGRADVNAMSDEHSWRAITAFLERAVKTNQSFN